MPNLNRRAGAKLPPTPPPAGANLNRRAGANAAALGFVPFLTSPACASVSALVAAAYTAADTDAAGTARACAAANAALFGAVAVGVALI